MMSDVAETLEELAAGLANGQMTSARLVERSLERVARLDRRLNSFVAIDEEGRSLRRRTATRGVSAARRNPDWTESRSRSRTTSMSRG
jgi:Asp-tRNA(Asn)/Glu-tRNA(Gln) amidotransferase A subunit family amidase